MGCKERIDVEALLVWAYRTQEVDRRLAAADPSPLPGVGESNWPTTILALGTRVDVSGVGARLSAAALARSRTADDAVTVHDAVLALGDMWIEARGDDVTIWTPEAAARVGCAIVAEGEGGAARWTLRPVTPNGRVADHVAATLTKAVTAPLLIQHARSASRPDWSPGWDGRAAVEWRGERDRWGRLRGSGRPLRAKACAQVALERATWIVWRAALACLAAELDGALDKWEVCGPAAPEAPWESRGARIVEALTVQIDAGGKKLKKHEERPI